MDPPGWINNSFLRLRGHPCQSDVVAANPSLAETLLDLIIRAYQTPGSCPLKFIAYQPDAPKCTLDILLPVSPIDLEATLSK